MAFDGVFLHCVKTELDSAVGSHIDKIYEPSRDELVLLLRKKGYQKRILLSVKSGLSRIHFTDDVPENPEIPPTFCAFMRKYFSGAYFEDIVLHGFERVIDLCFSCTDEMGDRVKRKIVCEFIAGSANVILVGENGKILDALKRTAIDSKRFIAPGIVYEYPLSRGKLNILTKSNEEILSAVKKGTKTLSDALLFAVDGFSPLVCREVAYRAYKEDISVTDMVDIKPLFAALDEIRNEIYGGGKPTMLIGEDKKPVDFSFTDITQYLDYYEKRYFESFGEMLDAFYKERERISRTKKAGGDVLKRVNNLLLKVKRRRANREAELDGIKDRESLRICGELLKANLHLIKNGASEVVLKNFYDENMADIRIKLDPSLTPQNNAARYFKEYKKSYNAEQSLKKLIAEDGEEEEYLESILESLSRAVTLSDVREVADELKAAGYIKETSKKPQKKKSEFSPLTYEKEGFKIMVGKNNLQNDYITTVLAKKGDLWFHTKNIHGAHAVIFCGGKEVSEETLLFTARLCAINSKAKHSSNVPVDYTDVRYVKKPAGAKAGMVIYTNNKTLFVTPEENI